VEEEIDRRLEERRVSDPCMHERDWIRLEQTVERHERELKELSTTGAETKVYMKQVLDSQSEIKASIKEIQEELKARPIEQITLAQKESKDMADVLKSALPGLIKILLVAIIIIAVFAGADGLVTKVIGGIP